jgi:saccharopepsin
MPNFLESDPILFRQRCKLPSILGVRTFGKYFLINDSLLKPFLTTSFRVNPPDGLGKFNDSGIALELLYGDGTYGTKGTIGVAPFQFGSYHVGQQAFMNVVESTISGLQELGIYGLMGLSFDFSTASPINRKIKSLYGAEATWGRSVLQNIFAQNASQPNFIAIDLTRTGDLEDTDGGSLLIGEYDDKYAGVAEKPKLPQYPKGGDRWSILLEGISVDGKAVAVRSTIAGVPAGSAQAVLDTGDATSIFPVAIHDAIYSSVPGAAPYSYDTGRVWYIPCNTTTHIELQFG